MASFFSHLRYSFGNEDPKTEEKALNIQPHDRVLCITASGDRPLNLLSRECQKMVCIDANPVQNYLLQLKAAAMRVLDYPEYIAFLGAVPGKNRKQSLRRLLPYLDPKAAQFWVENEKMITKGVLYQGAVERLTYYVAKAFRFLRGNKVNRLFAMDNIEDQRRFVEEEWDSYFWRQTFNLILNPLISKFFISDPGLANVGTNIKPGTYIYERIHACLNRELAKKTILLSLVLQGRVSQEAFAPYLTESGTQTIKSRLSTLEIHTSDVIQYLESVTQPSFDVFSLSDVASYLTYPDFVRLLKNILRTAKPGARFCLRQFLSSYEIPANLQPYFERNRALEQHLEQTDNCFVYRFITGTISLPSPSVIPSLTPNSMVKKKKKLVAHR